MHIVRAEEGLKTHLEAKIKMPNSLSIKEK